METKQKEESELIVFVKIKVASYVLLGSGKSPAKYRYSILNPLTKKELYLYTV